MVTIAKSLQELRKSNRQHPEGLYDMNGKPVWIVRRLDGDLCEPLRGQVRSRDHFELRPFDVIWEEEAYEHYQREYEEGFRVMPERWIFDPDWESEGLLIAGYVTWAYENPSLAEKLRLECDAQLKDLFREWVKAQRKGSGEHIHSPLVK